MTGKKGCIHPPHKPSGNKWSEHRCAWCGGAMGKTLIVAPAEIRDKTVHPWGYFYMHPKCLEEFRKETENL